MLRLRVASEPLKGLTQGLTRTPKTPTPGRSATPTGRHTRTISERDTGFEPATLSLGSNYCEVKSPYLH